VWDYKPLLRRSQSSAKIFSPPLGGRKVTPYLDSSNNIREWYISLLASGHLSKTSEAIIDEWTCCEDVKPVHVFG
jgi:hypothetical protein